METWRWRSKLELSISFDTGESYLLFFFRSWGGREPVPAWGRQHPGGAGVRGRLPSGAGDALPRRQPARLPHDPGRRPRRAAPGRRGRGRPGRRRRGGQRRAGLRVRAPRQPSGAHLQLQPKARGGQAAARGAVVRGRPPLRDPGWHTSRGRGPHRGTLQVSLHDFHFAEIYENLHRRNNSKKKHIWSKNYELIYSAISCW